MDQAAVRAERGDVRRHPSHGWPSHSSVVSFQRDKGAETPPGVGIPFAGILKMKFKAPWLYRRQLYRLSAATIVRTLSYSYSSTTCSTTTTTSTYGHWVNGLNGLNSPSEQ